MDNAVIIDKRMETIIKQRQVVVGTFDNPVSHGVGSQIDAVAFVGTGLSLQRRGVVVFSI